jgi:hypothetical protein
MRHRHIEGKDFSLPAIDDIIGRGEQDDWVELRKAVLADRSLLEDVVRICRAHISDPYAQRYHFWNYYARQKLA